MIKTKVIFLGNPLIREDSLGYKAYLLLKDKLSNEIKAEITYASTPNLDLLDMILNTDTVIIIDKVLCKSQGDLILLDMRKLASETNTTVSSHELSPLDIIKLGFITLPEEMPKRIILIGIIKLNKESLKKIQKLVLAIYNNNLKI